MNDKIKNIVLPIVMAVVLLGTSIWHLASPQQIYSESERRALATMPEVSIGNFLSGQFQTDFESYTLDQFPQRDRYRSVKAILSQNVFQKKDNHNLYLADGYLAKMEYPLSETMLDYSAERFTFLYDKYMKEYQITPYLVMVPDKNYFLAEKYGYLSIDYDACMEYFCGKVPFMHNIDITQQLSIEDYYRTDTHWRQEKILDIAETVLNEMGGETAESYETKESEYPFYGVYYGQAALPVSPDTLEYLTNAELEQCTVTNYDSGSAKKAFLYNLDKLNSKDPYEMFLEGATAMITIENPNAATDRELVIFRDSFGSSLAPLLVHNYAKVTLVDIRYVQSGMVGNFVSFENADVLFVYSTLLLNNSLAFK